MKKIRCKLGLHKWGQWESMSALCKAYRHCTRCNKSQVKKIQHSWENWLKNPNKTCTKIRICSKCNHQEISEAQHEWGKWKYIAGDDCRGIRICKKCGEKEMGPHKHKWEDWTSTSSKTDTYYIKQTYKILKKFTKGEIQNICFLLGIDHEDLDGSIKTTFAISLIKTSVRTKRFHDLLREILENIDNISVQDKNIIKNIYINTPKPNIGELDNIDWNNTHLCKLSRTCSRCTAIDEKYNHDWGTPTHKDSLNCDLESTCQACGEKKNVGKKHQWGDWVQDANSPCSTRLRTCRKCNAEEHHDLDKEKHIWTEWQASARKPCSKNIRTCSKCGKKQERLLINKRHKWGSWRQHHSFRNRIVRTCEICGAYQQHLRRRKK